jgi:hypothetical protein
MVYKYYGKYKEKLEDSNGVNRSRKWKDRQKKWPKEKGQKCYCVELCFNHVTLFLQGLCR